VIAAATRIGPFAFLIYCAYSMIVFVILGAAWLASAPGERLSRLGAFCWGRMLREAVSDLLPFSQIGGIVVGTRWLMQTGIAAARVYSSLVVDLTTEMASQFVFTIFGLAMMTTVLASGAGAASLRPLVLGGTAIMAVGAIAFFLMQKPAISLAEKIAGHFLPPSAATAIMGLRDELSAAYARRDHVLTAFLLNLAAWIASALGAWLVLAFMDVPVSGWTILSIESLIFTIRSIAFMLPGAIGVQEAGYALAAPLFGIPVEAALALSLIKRAKDIAIGLPTLLAWQALEGGKLWKGRSRSL
jgi:putative membrane protein